MGGCDFFEIFFGKHRRKVFPLIRVSITLLATHMNHDARTNAALKEKVEFLIAAARNGDAATLGLLLEQFRPYLLKIANEGIDPKLKSKVGGSDVVQQSMLDAGQSFAEFQGESYTAFTAWLRRILNNNVSNVRRHYRSEKRNVLREVQLTGTDSKAQDMRTLTASSTSSSGPMHEQEEFEQMTLAISLLSEDHRRVIHLRNYHKKSFQQIGDEIGRSPDAARKLWARGIESLQQIFPDLD